MSVCPLITWEWVGRLSPNFQCRFRVPRELLRLQNIWGLWVGADNLHFCFSLHRRRLGNSTGRNMGSPNLQLWAALATGWPRR